MESVKLQVQVVRDQLNKLQEDVKILQGKTLKITVDASGFEALDKAALRALKSSNDLAIAQEKTAQANAKAAAEASKAAAAQAKQAAEAEKTARAEARAAAQAEKSAQANAKAAAEAEKTAQANAKVAAEAQKTAQANAKVAAETEKTAQAQAKLATQQERTNTVQAQAALQTERTATANVQLATQQERSVTSAINLEAAQTRAAAAAERGAAAQRMQNDAMREGDPLARLLGDSLGNIVAKMAAWQIIGTAVSTVIRSFREAIATMKEVDTELTNIQKVSGLAGDELKKLGDSAYDTASKYGVAAQEYLSAVYTFQKAGLGDSAAKMGELATKTMLVGDTTDDVASKFLIAVNAAWKLNGSYEALNRVVDEADYINNNYATDLEKLSAGMPIVASTAANMNMSIEETLAVLGTITSITQETGTKAATAWRALAMNIAGEIGTITDETGETIEVTKEGVKSISDAMAIYGNAAVQAARSTGQVIDPMQAVISLAQAYRDGLLNDIELTNILMSVGGKLRTNQLTALVKDLASDTSIYYDILSKLPDAAGTADAEIGIMLSSWEAKTQKLKNAWTEFISHLVNTEAIKSSLDALTGFVYVLDSAFGKLLITVGALGAALYAISAHPIIAAITGAIGLIGMIAYQIKEANKRIEEAYPELYALNDAIRDTDEAVKNAKASYADTVEETEAAAVTASHYVDALRDLEKEGLQTEQSQNRYRAIVELLNELIPSLNLQIDETTGKLTQQSEAVLDNVDAWKEKAVQDALQQQYNEIYRAQADLTIEKVRAQIALEQELTQLEENRVKLAQLQSQQNQAAINGDREAYKKLAVQIAATGRAIRDGEEAVQKYGDAIEEADGKSTDYTEQLNELDQVNGKLKNGIDDVTDATQDNTDATKDNTDAKKENAEAAKSVQQETDALEQQVKAAGAALKDFEAYGNLTTDSMNALRDVMPDVVRGLFNEEGALNAAGVAAFETAGKLDSTTSAAQYLQAAANSAYYGNLITQIAQVGATAAVSAGQVVSLLSVIGGYSKNVSMDQLRGMERTAKEKGTTVQQEFSNYISAGNYLSNFKSQLASAQSEAARITANHTKSSGSSKGSSGSSRKSGSSSSSASTKDERLEALKQTVEDAKAAYNLLEKQGAAEERLRDAAVAVQNALHNQAAYLRSISADQADIDELSADWWSWQEKINDSYGNAVKAAKNQLSFLEAIVVSEADAADHDQKRIEQMRVIQEELHKQADYLRSIGADKEEIKKLSIEWWQWEGKIRDILQQQTEELKKQAEEREKAIEAAEKARDQAFADADSDTLVAIKEQVALRQSELDLIEAEYAARVAQLEAERASEEEIQRVTQEGENKAIVKREEIRQWLLGQIKIMEEIGAKQTDINAAWTQYYKIGGDIQKQIKNVKDELSDIFKQLTADFEDELEAARDAIIEPLQQQIDLLKAAHDQVKDQREEEEKLLAVEKARKALYNVERNRNVRYYNADAGQWEWTWNAKELEQAQEDLRSAEKNLSEYYADRDYEIAITNLEEQVKMTNAAYDEFRKAWRDASKRIQDGSMSVEEAIALLRETTTRAMDKYQTDLGASFNKISAVLTTYENKVTELTRKQLERENLIGNLLSSTISSHTDAVRQYTDELLRQRDRLREEAQQQYERDVDKANENYYPDSPTGKRYYSEDGFIIDAKTGRRVADEAAGAVLVDGGDSYRMGDGTTVDKQGEATRLTDAEAAAQIKDYGRQWREAYAAGDQAAMDAAHAAALGIGQSRGWTYDNGYWYYPNGTRVYDEGGILRGMGGIKATERDEAVLDPDTTAELLKPEASFQLQNSLELMRKIAKEGPLRSYEMLTSGGGLENLNSMGVLRSYQAPQQVRAQFGSAGNVYNNGNSYTMNGVTIGEQQADAMTVRQFVEYVNGFDNLPLM